jgi:hypothetical protein
MLISELTPEQLDYWVAQAQGLETFSSEDGRRYTLKFGDHIAT